MKGAFMKRSSGPCKAPSKFSESLHQQLNMYALAASAVGVGVLALAQPAEAKIVHKRLHVTIGSYELSPAGALVAPFGIFQANSAWSTYVWWARVSFNPGTAGAEFVRAPGSSWSVAALPEGAVIDHKARWGGYRGLVATYGPAGGGTFKHHRGGFQFGHPAFVGFKFLIEGKPHYGWARLTAHVVKFPKETLVSAVLTGYAYETVPNKSIIAGATKGPDEIDTVGQMSPASPTAPIPGSATLGMLAMGSPGLSIWRRKESALPAQ